MKRLYPLPVILFSRRILAADRAYALAAVLGVGLIVGLNLFIISIYDGVRLDATGYVRDRHVDLWVAGKDATNLKLSLSYYNTHWEDTVAATSGVEAVASVLRTVASARFGDERVDLFVFGLEPSQRLAIPETVDGTASIGSGEIILDSGFAAKHGLVVGDSIQIHDEAFIVRGLSAGTNSIVMQMAFVTHADAERLMRFFGILSYTMVRVQPGASPSDVADRLEHRLPNHDVITHEKFVRNNLAIVEEGTLPILLVINSAGVIAGGLLLTLMMFALVTDRREDYATLKAVGASQAFLARLVLSQSLVLVSIGYGIGLVSYFLFRPVLMMMVPTMTMSLQTSTAVVVFVASLAVGLIGASLPIAKLRTVYPMEAFRS